MPIQPRDQRYVITMASKPGFAVQNDEANPPTSRVTLYTGNGGSFFNIFSQSFLPSDAVSCWRVKIIQSQNASIIYLGVRTSSYESKLCPSIDPEAVGWHGYGWKHSHQIQHTWEPGMGCFLEGDVFHLKYDPNTLQLHLRVDRVPNKHFVTSVKAGTEYYACISMYSRSVVEIQSENKW